MGEQKLDERKLNIIKSGSTNDIVESIRKLIERVVDGKC